MDLSFNVNLHNQTRHLLHRRYLARKKTNLNMNLNREIDRGITEYQKIPTFKTPTPELPKNLLTQKPNRAPISQKPHTQNSALQTKPAKATQPKTSPPKKKPHTHPNHSHSLPTKINKPIQNYIGTIQSQSFPASRLFASVG